VDVEQSQSRDVTVRAVSRHLDQQEAKSSLPPLTANCCPPIMPGMINQPGQWEKTRMNAYELWLAAGRLPGREWEFWLQAERDFLDRKADEERSAD
jgi:hypothetical protein